MLIKSHEQLNQAVCETFFSSQLSKMGSYQSLFRNVKLAEFCILSRSFCPEASPAPDSPPAR